MRLILIQLTAAAVLILPSAAGALVADEADDVCGPTVDPCVVSTTIDIVSGSTLDFGTRQVRVASSGVLDTGNGIATILCGGLTLDAGSGPGLRVRGPNGFGQVDGGVLTVFAQRGCSLDPARPCSGGSECSLGACSARVCTGLPTRLCTTDTNCDLGVCGGNNRCTGGTSVECESDDDCKVGTCDVNVCALDRSQLCQSDEECNFGTCSVGDGSITTNRSIRADGAFAGELTLFAAGDIVIGGTINAGANTADNDGGTIDLLSNTGSVTINSTITSRSGSLGTGGEIFVDAAQDVIVNATIDMGGGDFDGGFITLEALRDVIINASLLANSNSGGGFGGEVSASAGRDLMILGSTTLNLDGHFSALDAFGGDGGFLDLFAERNLSMGSSVVVRANGAEPDGFGGDMLIESGSAFTLAGRLEAKPRGSQGAGGLVELAAGTTFNFPSGARIDITGANSGGGALFVESGANATLNGLIDGRTSNNGPADSIDIDVEGTATMAGTIQMSGAPENQTNGQVTIEACTFRMNSPGKIDNLGGFGLTDIKGREQIVIGAGTTITADAVSGTNRLRYRDPAKPPVLNGTISPPAAPNDVDPTLVRCAICGNGFLDFGEVCDDGNTANGDGCNASCINEGCIAQSIGFPASPLCNDNNACTVDTCDNDTSTCEHVIDCDDDNECTVDSCSAQLQCQNTLNDADCQTDAEPCTTQYCSLVAGRCITINNDDFCDDGAGCTGPDQCTFGVCFGDDLCPDGQTCNFETDMCEGLAAECGNALVEDGETCDDGDTEWVPGEFCSSDCRRIQCGDINDSLSLTASDALFILRTAVSLEVCHACVCNVDSNPSGNPVTASDALFVLRLAVGIGGGLNCPAC